MLTCSAKIWAVLWWISLKLIVSEAIVRLNEKSGFLPKSVRLILSADRPTKQT